MGLSRRRKREARKVLRRQLRAAIWREDPRVVVAKVRARLEELHAEQERQAGAVHGDVLDGEGSGEGQGQVPAGEGGEGVPPGGPG